MTHLPSGCDDHARVIVRKARAERARTTPGSTSGGTPGRADDSAEAWDPVQERRSVQLGCSVQARCGGCPWLGTPADEQARHKLQALSRACSAVGLSIPPPRWIGHCGPIGYRNRVRLRVDGGRVVFFNTEKALSCVVLEEPLRAAVLELVELSGRRSELLAAVRHLELRVDERGGVVLALYRSPGASPLTSSAQVLLRQRSWSVQQRLWMPSGALPADQEEVVHQRSSLRGDAFALVPASCFRQINRWVNQRVLGLLARGAIRRLGSADASAPLRGVSLLDVYCGAGNLGLSLLALGARGSFIERDVDGLSAVLQAASQQSWALVDASAQSLDEWIADHHSDAPPDLVLVNPPRAGLRTHANSVPRLGAKYCFAMYCDVDAFARDARVWTEGGYRLEALWGADMFPNTRHVETVAWFRRTESVGARRPQPKTMEGVDERV